jgi:hypothetical protein
METLCTIGGHDSHDPMNLEKPLHGLRIFVSVDENEIDGPTLELLSELIEMRNQGDASSAGCRPELKDSGPAALVRYVLVNASAR